MENSSIILTFDDVTKKRIVTPNHFVSHMIEHIAWRLGVSIDLLWKNENWKSLGQSLGVAIAKFPRVKESAASLGMIDDGSACVTISFNDCNVTYSDAGGVKISELFESRCEQIHSGAPLQELLVGLSEGLKASISIEVWSFEDPHHTWEGIFRGIGIALSQIYMPRDDQEKATLLIQKELSVEKQLNEGELVVLEKGLNRATVRRGTAETGVIVTVDLCSSSSNEIKINVDESIAPAVKEVAELFDIFAKSAGIQLSVDFAAKSLSSSHVVMEDIGLVIGRALLEILKLRMAKYGCNGAGSNIANYDSLQKTNVRVGVNIEGRKFWRLIPKDGRFDTFRTKFVIGQNVLAGLRSEDLDDFIDGLSGGLSASVMVHIQNYADPESTWVDTFTALGSALRECFIPNPYRKGVPPGVKATLS